MPVPTLVPDPQVLLEIQPEEVGGIVLQVLHEGVRSAGGLENFRVSRYNFGLYHTVQGYPQDLWPGLLRTLMEGWAWLEKEGFLAPEPEQEGWYFITRKGARYRSAADLRTYREASRFPRSLLHPRVE
jgi:hypothetical protein